MPNPVVHFEINGRDSERLREFYSGLFGWQMDPMPDLSYTNVMPGEGINGGIGQVDKPEQSYVTFYIQVDDPQKYLDDAVARGGRVLEPVMEIPGVVTLAVFADPEGHPVGLVKANQQ